MPATPTPQAPRPAPAANVASPSRRRPYPALVFLLVLALLTAIVWWRVLHRSDADTSSKPTAPVTAKACVTPGSKIILPKPGAVSTTVLNGAQRTGLASQVAVQLKARGFAVAAPANAPALTGVAQIRFGSAGRMAATLLSYQVPGAVLTPVTRAGTAVDLILGTGFKSLATPAAAAASAAASRSC